MKDIHNETDMRSIPIDKVGIKGIRYPIVILDKADKQQHTIATINMFVDLPHNFKGTHMSRFVEILNKYRKKVHITTFPAILSKMLEVFSAKVAHLELQFPYFIEKKAPVSGALGLMEYECFFHGSIGPGALKDFVLGVKVPVMTLCPCSKAISSKGAHNQRGTATVSVRYEKMLWIEDLVSMIEECGSSPVYSVLKRPDEKYVTERAFENPKFVEDVVRDAAVRLNEHPCVSWYKVEAENAESIHNHNAYASIECRKTGED